MKIISLLSLKGGVGKTMLALHLATEGCRNNLKAIILDLDPQQSSRFWKMGRDSHSYPPVVSDHLKNLSDTIKILEKEGYEYCFIDTPPNLVDEFVRQAVILSHYIIVPSSYQIMDIATSADTGAVGQLAKKPTLIVLNRMCRGTKRQESALKFFRQKNFDVCPYVIQDRIPIADALTERLTIQEYAELKENKGNKSAQKGKEEIINLYKFIIKEVNDGY